MVVNQGLCGLIRQVVMFSQLLEIRRPVVDVSSFSSIDQYGFDPSIRACCKKVR